MDTTKGCGYTVPEQRNLLVELKRIFEIPVILVANKADLGGTFKGTIEVSAKEGKGIEELKKEISNLIGNK